jgi:hypothetical protein
MNEVWVPVVGYEGFYAVSDNGRVKSVNDKRKYKWVNEHVLKPQVLPSGYLQVGLSKNNKTQSRRLSRIVLESFIHSPSRRHQANHINGVKTDNRLENLEWVTPSENISHAIKTGLISLKYLQDRMVGVQKKRTEKQLKNRRCITCKEKIETKGYCSAICKNKYLKEWRHKKGISKKYNNKKENQNA